MSDTNNNNNNNSNNDEDEEEVVVASRGANYTFGEDLLLSKAWIRASEDPIVGANQRTLQFKKTFYEQYKTLVSICNAQTGSKHGERTMPSAHNRFKKMSRLILKYIGCESSCGDPPSGDNDREEWDKRVKKLFLQRNPDAKNCFEGVITAKEFLSEFPKCRAFEEENEEERVNGPKRKRPEGNKKAKEKEADKKFIMNCLNGSLDGSEGDDAVESKKTRYIEKKETFLDNVNNTMAIVAQAFTDSMKDANVTKLLESPFLSEEQKSNLAAQLYSVQMQAMTTTVPPSTVNVSGSASALTDEQENNYGSL